MSKGTRVSNIPIPIDNLSSMPKGSFVVIHVTTYPTCGFYFSCNNILLGENNMWFDKVLLDYWLLYATKHFVVVCCVVNQIKTFKKWMLKQLGEVRSYQMWWNFTFIFWLFHASLILFYIHHRVRVYVVFFFVSNQNLMCYVAFYAHCLLVQSYWHCNCKIIIFKLIVWTSRFFC